MLLRSIGVSATHRSPAAPIRDSHLTTESSDDSSKIMSIRNKKIGGFSEGHLVKVACENVEKKTKDTVVLDTEAEERIPKFDSAGKKKDAQSSPPQFLCSLSLLLAVVCECVCV